MVVKSRIRAILLPIAFYAVSGVTSGFFVWQASKGERGLRASAEYEAQTAALADELKAVQADRSRWERRVNLMRSEAVDRDLLDEEARASLDVVGRNDLVIYTHPASK
jgi:cell division protein FtsB